MGRSAHIVLQIDIDACLKRMGIILKFEEILSREKENGHDHVILVDKFELYLIILTPLMWEVSTESQIYCLG